MRTKNYNEFKALFESSSLLEKAYYNLIFHKYLDFELRNKFFHLFDNESDRYGHCQKIIQNILDECVKVHKDHFEIIKRIDIVRAEIEQNLLELGDNDRFRYIYYIVSEFQFVYSLFSNAPNITLLPNLVCKKDYYLSTPDILEQYVNRMYNEGYLEFIAMIDVIALKYGIDLDELMIDKAVLCCEMDRNERDRDKLIKHAGSEIALNKLLQSLNTGSNKMDEPISFDKYLLCEEEKKAELMQKLNRFFVDAKGKKAATILLALHRSSPPLITLSERGKSKLYRAVNISFGLHLKNQNYQPFITVKNNKIDSTIQECEIEDIIKHL